MDDAAPPTDADRRPTLVRDIVRLRPGSEADVAPLHAVLAGPGVVAWWGEPQSAEQIRLDLAGEDETVLLVIEVDGEVVGGIQYSQELDPMYRHAGIDIFLDERASGRGVGREAVALLARHLVERLGHHRLTMDPAADNERAIRCYASVGFRPVGRLRAYERTLDGTFRDGLLMDLLADELVDAPPRPSPSPTPDRTPG
ncbi:MAG TPA: GNAT family protein [Aquihabitans sp.]|nr:GNAT family protein [Aquihabitans sp.]